MSKGAIVAVAVIVGILFLILTAVYWLIPAGSLPAFIPGFEEGSTRIHYTHGVAALVIGLAAFALAWFQSGKKSTQQK